VSNYVWTKYEQGYILGDFLKKAIALSLKKHLVALTM
jgi:hypothetical protein